MRVSVGCEKVDNTVGKFEHLQQHFPSDNDRTSVEFQMIRLLNSSEKHLDTLPHGRIASCPVAVSDGFGDSHIAIIQRLGAVAPEVTEQDVGEQL